MEAGTNVTLDKAIATEFYCTKCDASGGNIIDDYDLESRAWYKKCINCGSRKISIKEFEMSVKKCSVEGCDKQAHVKGVCDRHFHEKYGYSYYKTASAGKSKVTEEKDQAASSTEKSSLISENKSSLSAVLVDKREIYEFVDGENAARIHIINGVFNVVHFIRPGTTGFTQLTPADLQFINKLPAVIEPLLFVNNIEEINGKVAHEDPV